MVSSGSVHVLSQARERCVALVIGKVEEEGFELLDEELGGSVDRRVWILASQSWLSLIDALEGANPSASEPSVSGVDGASEWCRFLSLGLDTSAYLFDGQEEEGALQVAWYHQGEARERVDLPRDTYRDPLGGASVVTKPIAGGLPEPFQSRLQRPVELADEPLLLSFGDPEEELFVPLEHSDVVLASSMGLPFGLYPPPEVPTGLSSLQLEFRRLAAP